MVFSKLLSKSSYAVILLIYTLIFHRRDIFLYKILAFMLLSLAKVAILIKATIIVILFFALQIFRDRVSIKLVLLLVAISFLVILITGGFDPVIARVRCLHI